MCKVLKGAEVGDLNDVVSRLVPPKTFTKRLQGQLQSLVGWFLRKNTPELDVFKEILQKWNPHSWEELARAVEDSHYGLNFAQKIRELSGSGRELINMSVPPDTPHIQRFIGNLSR